MKKLWRKLRNIDTIKDLGKQLRTCKEDLSWLEKNLAWEFMIVQAALDQSTTADKELKDYIHKKLQALLARCLNTGDIDIRKMGGTMTPGEIHISYKQKTDQLTYINN